MGYWDRDTKTPVKKKQPRYSVPRRFTGKFSDMPRTSPKPNGGKGRLGCCYRDET